MLPILDIGVPTVSMIGNVNGLQEPLRYNTPMSAVIPVCSESKSERYTILLDVI